MKTTRNYLSQEDFDKIIAAIPNLKLRKYKPYDIGMLFKLCYRCNLRISEGLNLEAKDFDFERHEIFLGDTKSNKADIAIIPDQFIPELQLWVADKQGRLFPGIKYNNVYLWLKNLGKRLQLLPLLLPRSETHEFTITHIFRKSEAKDLYYGTHGEIAPLSLISKSLRHKGKNPLVSTMQYLKLGEEDLKDYWARVNKK